MIEGLSVIMKQLERQKAAIDKALVALREVDGIAAPVTAAPATTEAPRVGKKRSAATRRRMKEAQQRRWATAKGASEPPSPVVTPEAPKAKRKISAEGLARIIAATKKRWRLARAAAKAESAAPRKSAPKKGAVKKAALAKAAKNVAPVKKAAVRKSSAPELVLAETAI